jgi:predicted transcriptional regulator
MIFGSKRDRVQIIAEILNSCKVPQSKTSIRRHTDLSYGILQNCIMHLLMRQWIELTGEENGQQKLIITDKGAAFLEKWQELQKMAGIKSKHKFKPLREGNILRIEDLKY